MLLGLPTMRPSLEEQLNLIALGMVGLLYLILLLCVPVMQADFDSAST